MARSNLFGFTLSIGAGLFIAACSKQNKPQMLVWSAGSGTPPPAFIRDTQFKTKEMSLLSKDELIERAPQKIGAAEIEGAFIQQISDSKGQVIYVKTQYYPQDLSYLTDEIEKHNKNRFLFLENFKKINPNLKSAYKVFDPKTAIITSDGLPKVAYYIEFIDSTRSVVYRMTVLPNSKIIATQKVSSGFEDGKGTVFPVGPKASQLSEVVLSGLMGDGTLTKENIKVSAQIPEKAHSSNLVFEYDPQDVRFDQVQSFFYVDQALTYFKSKMGISLPFALEIQTHFGAPEKLNAMFYYHGQIRLGTGDGINYNNVMKDPSIVIHESCHSLIDAVAHLPLGEGEGGSINEAFADFFTTLYLNNPKLGEVAFMKAPYKRSVENNMKLSEKNGGLYHDSLIISGTLWEIKETLGSEKTIDLAIKTLSRIGPSGDLFGFNSAVQYALSQGFSIDDTRTVNAILKKRGWITN